MSKTSYSDLDKIAMQVVLPSKPRFISISDLLLFVSMIVLAIFCFDIHTYERMTRVFFNSIACIFFVIATIIAISVIKRYVTTKREYKLAQEDAWSYRKYKALQFVRQNDKNIKDNEMLIEWLNEHPQKNQLPECVKEAIRMGDSNTLKYYLDWVAENKTKIEV